MFTSAWEVHSKAEWEGGLVDLITGYGVKSSDLPESFPQEIIEAWDRIEAIQGDINIIQAYLNAHLDEEEE